MIDTFVALLRAALAGLGLLTFVDPTDAGTLAAVAVVLLSVAALVVATLTASTPVGARGSRAHPTRRAELAAPLAQSDPDAAGHVRRRGPGRAAAAA